MITISPFNPTNSNQVQRAIQSLARSLEIGVVELGAPKHPAIVAYDGEKVIGCVWATDREPFDLDIGVSKEYRGANLSYQMLAAWLRLPSMEALEHVALNATVTNQGMQRVLEFAQLRNDGRNNYSGTIEVARLLTFLELSEGEFAPGLVLWLHSSTLLYLKAHCECLSADAVAKERHPFVCLSASDATSLWMPLNSKPGMGRYPIRTDEKTGHNRPGDSWLTKPSFYHPTQVWVCSNKSIRYSLSGERTTPTTRNRVSSEVAAEMLKRARLILKNPSLLGS